MKIQIHDSREPGQMEICYFDTPVGRLEIGEDGEGICQIGFTDRMVSEEEKKPDSKKRHSGWRTEGIRIYENETPLLKQAKRELAEYFEGKRQVFDLPLSFYGTRFQMTVWSALTKIPFGETRSYGQVAAAAGSPKGSRAVGMANHNNPIAIVVPCHRVIGAGSELVGYGGGLDVKEKLLRLEGRMICQGRVV